jgi:hypothetical protein
VTAARRVGQSGLNNSLDLQHGCVMPRGRAAPPPAAFTVMAVVSQLLGEAVTSAGGEDEEWMYAVGDGESTVGATAGTGHTKVQRRLGATDAQAIREAREVLRGGGGRGRAPGGARAKGAHATHAIKNFADPLDDKSDADTDRTTISSGVDNGSARSWSEAPSTGTTCTGTTRGGPGAAADQRHLPLIDSNRVFMLLGDIARMRERGVVPSAPPGSAPAAAAGGSLGPVAALTQHSGSASPTTPEPRVTPRGGGGGGPMPVVAPAAVAAIDAKLQEVDAAVARWESQYPAAAPCVAAVQALALKLRQVVS